MMTRAYGSPTHTNDERPIYIDDTCRPVEMVDANLGHVYHLRRPVRLAYSKDPTREDVVDEANKTTRAVVDGQGD